MGPRAHHRSFPNRRPPLNRTRFFLCSFVPDAGKTKLLSTKLIGANPFRISHRPALQGGGGRGEGRVLVQGLALSLISAAIRRGRARKPSRYSPVTPRETRLITNSCNSRPLIPCSEEIAPPFSVVPHPRLPAG